MEGWRQIGGGLANDKENADGRITTAQMEPGRKYRDVSLPFSPDLLYGSRPPVQAALRLASLGLDGARPRSEGNYGYEKMAGSVLAVLVRLPLVGTEHPAITIK